MGAGTSIRRGLPEEACSYPICFLLCFKKQINKYKDRSYVAQASSTHYIAESDAEHLVHLPLPYNAGITGVYHFAQFYEMLET